MSDQTRTLDDLLDGERTAMLVTADQRSRPMTIVERDGTTLWFLTTRDADWVAQLPEAEIVNVSVVDPADALYVSLTGTATTTTDQQVLDRLWKPAMEAWFDGSDDPQLVALAVEVSDGEYWDGPDGGVARTLRLAAAAVTGSGSELMGDKGDVST